MEILEDGVHLEDTQEIMGIGVMEISGTLMHLASSKDCKNSGLN